MPVNRNALIRYRIIDTCLRNRHRKWTLEDLIDTCSDALYELQGMDKRISRRTIQSDIEMMRSGKLGYEAPIVVIDKRYYTYGDREFSITNIPLDSHDIHLLSEVSLLLRQFKGFRHHTDINEMVSKLEDKIHVQRTQSAPVVEFEKNDNLKGLEWIEVIRTAIVGKQTLDVTYQSFKARAPGVLTFSPYLLKEYRNRWFVLGRVHRTKNSLLNLALDRIQDIGTSPEVHVENDDIDLASYYDNVIGVTKTPGQRECLVVFWMDRSAAPYIITKPLHHTQQLLREDEQGQIFSIKVVLNFELERELLGFGDKLKVLSPRILVKRIPQQLRSALARYDTMDGMPG